MAESLLGRSMLVEWVEQSVRSSPGEPSFLFRHFADEHWTTKDSRKRENWEVTGFTRAEISVLVHDGYAAGM